MEAITLSWVLAARDPQQLARFYADLLDRDPEPGLSPQHWRLMLPGGSMLEIYRPSRQRPFPAQGRSLAPCLKQPADPDPVVVLQRWVDRARQLGASVAEPPRRESFGAEAWMLDPEGNALLLLVPRPPASKQR